ncbi:UNVERIFIED_CONTAM: hypothetical protein K2H54_061054 [Gekko kuhli]
MSEYSGIAILHYRQTSFLTSCRYVARKIAASLRRETLGEPISVSKSRVCQPGNQNPTTGNRNPTIMPPSSHCSVDQGCPPPSALEVEARKPPI